MAELKLPKGFGEINEEINTFLIVNDDKSFTVAKELISDKYNILSYNDDIKSYDWETATDSKNVILFMSHNEKGDSDVDYLKSACKKADNEIHSVKHTTKRRDGFLLFDFANAMNRNKNSIIEYIDNNRKHVANFKNNRIKELSEGRNFAPLGYSGDNYYFFKKGNKAIVCVPSTRIEAKFLKSLDDIHYWENKYLKTLLESGIAKSNLYTYASREIMKECESLGTYSEEDRNRSVGFWRDGDDFIYHNGANIYSDKLGKQELFDYTLVSDAKKVYTSSKELTLRIENEITKSELDMVEKLIKTSKFRIDQQANVLLGWMVVAPLGGLLSWRPNIWIKGQSGSGKSTVGKIIKELTMVDSRFELEGGTTEAGVRNSINGSSFPVFIDEFESEDDSGKKRKQAITLLMRLATSGGKVVQGINNLGGKNVYSINNCFCLMSINVDLDSQADLNRISIIELEKQMSDESREAHNEFKRQFYIKCNPNNKLIKNSINDEYNSYNLLRNKFITKTFNNLTKLLGYTYTSKTVLTKLTDDVRFADKMSSMVAGYAIFKGENIGSLEKAEAFINKNFSEIIADFFESKQKKDMQFRKDFLEAELMFPKEVNKFASLGTISELLRVYISAVKSGKNKPFIKELKEIMLRNGMKINKENIVINLENKFLSRQIYPNSEALEIDIKSFLDAEWEGVKGAFKSKDSFRKIMTVSFGGIPSKSIKFNYGILFDEYEESDDD